MKLPVIKNLNKQDIPGAPSWVDQLIGGINSFIEPVVSAIQGRLTFADNFYCQVKTLSFTHGTALSVSVPNRKIVGALPLLAIKSSDSGSTKNQINSFGIDITGAQTIDVTVGFAGGAGVTADVTFVVLFG